MINKISYLFLLTSLNSGYLLAWLLEFVAPLIPKKKRKDLFLFPDKQKGSDGYLRRFQEYFPFHLKDGITFDVADIYDHNYIIECENGPTWKRYWIYHKLFWKRFFQVLEARHYRAVFIHRKLFPYYPDQKKPNLLRLLNKLNNNVTLDFWDSIYIYDPELVTNSMKNVNKLSLVNQHLFNYFQSLHCNKFIWPIGVNIERYKVKTNYDIKSNIKLVWTGLPWNLPNLDYLKPIFKTLSKKYNLELVIICQKTYQVENMKITHHKFDINTFFNILPEMDIGIYPLTEDVEMCKGKMAMKVLDFMTAGLPVIGFPHGLSPYVINNDNFKIAETEKDWENYLEQLIISKELREKIGKNGRKMVEEYHNMESSYLKFKEIVFS